MFVFKRYFNLIYNFSNWYEYFRYKRNKLGSLRLITRKKGIEIKVNRELMGVFKEIFLHDFYNVKLIKSISSPSPTILDIGANVGYFTLLAYDKLFPKQILCFEPIQKNFDSLSRNLEFDKSNINKTFKLAVFKPGVQNIELFINSEKEFTVTASHYEKISLGSKKLICGCIDIAQIIEQNKLEKIDILKIDCEGSEYDILYSLDDKFWFVISAIIMEVHEIDHDTKNLNSLAKFIYRKKYTVKTRKINLETNMLWAWKIV